MTSNQGDPLGEIMATVTLPDYPTGIEFEEFISAYVQCSGRFVDRNLHERFPDDICELDIAATEHREDGYATLIVEVKSGNWRLHELFTLRGKMQYLGVTDGAIVSLQVPDKSETRKHVAEKINIQMACVDTHEQAEEALRPYLGQVDWEPLDIEVWRYSYWLGRQLREKLRRLKNSANCRKGPKVVWDYHEALQTNLFEHHMLERTREIYDLYGENPNLAAKWSAEMSGLDWDSDHERVAHAVFKEAYRSSDVHELHLATFVETKARLTILKNLVDYELYRRSHDEDELNTLMYTLLGMKVHFVDLLPPSFRDALKELRERPFFHRYAVLWQWFVWLFGGFILLDYEEHEYEQLGKVSGIPPNVIPEALRALDVLFPTEGGWFRNPSTTSHIRLLKMMPLPFCGVGANYRRGLYTDDGEYDSLNVTGQHTMCDLVRWNNCVVAYLSE